MHLSVGLHEGLLVPHVLALKQALCDHGLPESAVRLRVYDGGHDVAWWREELIDALGQVLSAMPQRTCIKKGISVTRNKTPGDPDASITCTKGSRHCGSPSN